MEWTVQSPSEIGLDSKLTATGKGLFALKFAAGSKLGIDTKATIPSKDAVPSESTVFSKHTARSKHAARTKLDAVPKVRARRKFGSVGMRILVLFIVHLTEHLVVFKGFEVRLL